MLTETDLKLLTELAVRAAEKTGDYILSKVGNHGEANTKEGGNTPASQVVTEVDYESQRIILETLGDSIREFNFGLLTEESEDDSSRLEADYFWCIDPLDGTLPFVEGSPGYSVSISLVSKAGDPVIGVIRDPDAQVTFSACKGVGAFINGGQVSINDEVEKESLTWFTDRSMKSIPKYSELVDFMEQLAAQMGYSKLTLINHAGSALNGAWVTKNAPAVYYKFPKPGKGGGSSWDFSASACILKEWGREPTDIFGDPLDLNKLGDTFMNERGVLYASDPKLNESIQQVYRDQFQRII